MTSAVEMETKRSSRFYRLSTWLSVAGLLAALVLAVVVREGYRHKPLAQNEVARAVSPDGKATALLYEVEGKGKIPFVYDVELTANGETRPVAHLAGAMRNEHAYGVDLRWAGSGELNLVYQQAQSAQVINDEAPVGSGKVTVVLKPGVRDADAPAGGMLFNLHQQQ